MRKIALGFALPLLLASVMLWGQAVSGTLSGRVTAASGAGVPNAAVTITNTDTNVAQKVLTGPDGSFSVAGLAPGTYRIDVETAGFKRTSQQNIQLTTSAPASVNITLQAGNMNETVEIKGTAPVIETNNGAIDLGVDTRTLRELPVIDRNHQQLVETQTGITPPEILYPLIGDPAHNRFFSTNGQSPLVNIWHTDGVVNLEPFRGTAIRVQPVESIQQMNILTSNYNAQNGFAGGGVMHNITRGGTNDWHGSLFEFHSNDELRSRPFFDQGGNPKPRFTYNQFGGTVGKAIVRDKTFFFGSYEGNYNRGENTILTTVPTPAMVGGNFSGVPGVTLFNPAAPGRTPFGSNTIPAASINPASAAIASQLPAPNLSGFANNYIANTPYENDYQKVDARIDQHFSDSTSAFLRYGYSNVRGLDSSPFGNVIGSGAFDRVVGQQAIANVTHSFTPALLTEFRFGYNRYTTNLGAGNAAGALGLGFGNSLPGITIPGMLPLGTPANQPMYGVDNGFDWVSNWTYHSGHHNVRFGVDIRRMRTDGFYGGLQFGGAGNAIFSPGATLSAGAGGISPLGGFANSFASFLLGAPGQIGATAFTEQPSIRQSEYGTYLTDTIQVGTKLSLDLGVRWDVFSPLEPRRAGGAMFYDPSNNSLNYAGVGGANMHWTGYDLNNVAPRVSFAYSPTTKTAIRGGYAINYFQNPYLYSGWMPTFTGIAAGVNGSFVPAPGVFGTTAGVTAPSFAGTTSLVNGTPAPNIPLNVVPRDIKTPYTQNFSLQVQQEVLPGSVLSVGYVGVLGRQLPYTQELNAALPGTGTAGLPLIGFGRTASTTLYTTGLTSNYNSLQVSLTKRFSQRLSFQGSYTFSKALGYTSGINNMLLNPFDRAANYGPLDWSRQHVLSISHVWELPFGAGTNHLNHGMIAQLVGNWQLNGIFSWATGSPLTITSDPLFCNCPNVTPGATVNGPVTVPGNIGPGASFFDTGAISTGAGLGNLGRGSLLGPGFTNYDMSLFRSFVFRDQYKLEFRGEVYNIANSPRFGNPVTSLTSPSFGQVTNTLNGAFGRQFDVAVRVLF